MDSAHDDSFVVYVRLDRDHSSAPEDVEHAVHYCSSYEEARRIRQECYDASQDCVIRYTGMAGGGD